MTAKTFFLFGVVCALVSFIPVVVTLQDNVIAVFWLGLASVIGASISLIVAGRA